ncbi:vegetative cell wall protein gp1-like [Ananas comosus]|uniref:Vegetative cell wall protein gp1-like n=1 Tax=Ananas comosus TaxID=4615 RepID=A0A6P5H3W8_ANACO|nr:vegetative cell wall protein gp1-like [Ananas comosus]
MPGCPSPSNIKSPFHFSGCFTLPSLVHPVGADNLRLFFCAKDLRYTYLGFGLSASAPALLDFVILVPVTNQGWTPLRSVPVGRGPDPPLLGLSCWTIQLGGSPISCGPGVCVLGAPLLRSSAADHLGWGPLPPPPGPDAADHLGRGPPPLSLGPIAADHQRGGPRPPPPGPDAADHLGWGPLPPPPGPDTADHLGHGPPPLSPGPVAADHQGRGRLPLPPGPSVADPTPMPEPTPDSPLDATVPGSPPLPARSAPAPSPPRQDSTHAFPLHAPPPTDQTAPPAFTREPSRSSARLRNQAASTALRRAMLRKASLSEGASCPGNTTHEWSRAILKAKSRRYGVALSDDEAVELRKFLLAEA